jgi:hypothetical protein
MTLCGGRIFLKRKEFKPELRKIVPSDVAIMT